MAKKPTDAKGAAEAAPDVHRAAPADTDRGNALEPATDPLLDRAIAETLEIIEANPERISDATLPVLVYAAKQGLEVLRICYEQGDKFALLAAMRECAIHSMVMPDWLARGFISAYDSVGCCEVGSWDEAFGIPYRKGAHLLRMRQDRINLFRVARRINERHKQGASLNRELFEEVGKELGVGRTKAEELWRRAKKQLPTLDPEWPGSAEKI
jgi:hypothetical protein